MRFAALFLFLLPIAAHAEVTDKESSALVVWAWAIVPTILAFLAARYRRWLLLLVLPAPILFFVAHLLEVTDPYVGPAIAQEAGVSYLVTSWGGPLALVLGVLLGLFLRRRVSSPSQPPSGGSCAYRPFEGLTHKAPGFAGGYLLIVQGGRLRRRLTPALLGR
jgi:hypothetical protein